MKLQVKTLTQKSLIIDIEDSKTVYDLKKELAVYPDIGVKPELQKLIYAGKILSNEDQLAAYNIDEKKFLVVMILKQPLADSPTTSITDQAAASSSNVVAEKSGTAKPVTADKKDEFKAPSAQPRAAAAAVAAAAAAAAAATTTTAKSKTEELVENIVSMGYPEGEVRRALTASFNNPERAIEYLIEGIPASTSALEEGNLSEDYEMTPFEVFRSDPLFRDLRRAIQQHPELIDEAIQRVGEANPAILNLINENQQEFLSMLLEPSDEEDDGDDE